MRVETRCSWSVGGDTQALIAGQTLQVSLTVNSTVTGLTPAANLAGGDSLNASWGSSAIATAKDNYAVSGENTKYGSGSGSGSVAITAGSTGQHKTIEFACLVDAGMGTTFTDWNYVWVEGPTPTASATPSISPTITETPTITTTPTITETPTITPTSTETPTATPTKDGNASGAGNDLAGLLGGLGLAGGVLGALLAAAGLLAILIDRGNKGGKQPPKPKGPQPPIPEPPQIHYSLRASTGSVDIRPQQPASVYLQALRVPLEGEPVIAPEAKIQVIVPETPAGLAAWPTSGMGSLECTFSIPTPKVCENLTVLAIATVGEQVKARTYVHVNILPVYELELKWEDPKQAALQVDGKEVRAWALVTAIPPDPNTGQDVLAQKVDVSMQGPNKDWIRQPLKPYIQEDKQWNAIAAVRPGAGSELQPGSPNLVANFSLGGQQLVARLPVELNQAVVLGAWVNGKKEADAIYNRKQAPAGWDFSEIVTFFHAPDNESKPSQPTFAYGFDTPPIQAEPPILDVTDFFESATIQGQYVIKVALKEATDLDTCFGETPADQRKIKVKVFVKDDKGNEYTDFVTYRVRPMVTFCVHAFEGTPSARNPQHEYREIGFKEEMGLVANGDDILRLAGYFMLTDKLAKSGPDPEERLDIGGGCGFAWRNPQDDLDFGEPQNDEVNSKDGFLCFEIKSKGALEATPDRINAVHNLILKPALRSDIPAAYSVEADVLEVKIAMQFLRLRLWVVPGVYRHTSEAVAYLDVLPAHQALADQELCLTTEAPAGMGLNLQDCLAKQNTYAHGSASPCGPGAVRWHLRYTGISWDGMTGAEFKVRVGLEDPPDEKWRADKRIHVHENLVALLNDLAEDAALARQINNPDRQDLVPVLEMPSLPTNRPWDTPENIEANSRDLKKDLRWSLAWPPHRDQPAHSNPE